MCSYIAGSQWSGLIDVCIKVNCNTKVYSNDVRPIAIGEVLRRATAIAMCSQSRASFLSFLICTYSTWYCNARRGRVIGPGLHHIQLLLEYHPELAVLKIDVKNAFNSVSRINLMQQVAKNFPDIRCHVRGSNVWTAEPSDLSKRWFSRNSAIRRSPSAAG